MTNTSAFRHAILKGIIAVFSVVFFLLPVSVAADTGTPTLYINIDGGVVDECSYLTEYIGDSVANSREEIYKLQAYLIVFEKADIEMTGVFDGDTRSAVKDFQLEKREFILDPWGISDATGYVYVTTFNAINDTYCGRDIALSPQEYDVISSVLSTKTEIALEEEDVLLDETYKDESVSIYEGDKELHALQDDLKDIAKVVIDEIVDVIEHTNNNATTAPIDTVLDKIEVDDNSHANLGSEKESLIDEDSSGQATGTLALGKTQFVGPAMGSSQGVKQLASLAVGYIDQYSLPILIVLVILLVIQLVLLWRNPSIQEQSVDY